MTTMGTCCLSVLGMWVLMISPTAIRGQQYSHFQEKYIRAQRGKATYSRAHSESLAEEGQYLRALDSKATAHLLYLLLFLFTFYCTNNNNGKNKINFYLTTSSKSAVSIFPHSLDSFLRVFITALLRYSSYAIKWTLFKIVQFSAFQYVQSCATITTI